MLLIGLTRFLLSANDWKEKELQTHFIDRFFCEASKMKCSIIFVSVRQQKQKQKKNSKNMFDSANLKLCAV